MSLRRDITKHAAIEALVREPSLAAAGRAIRVADTSGFRRMLANRFGLARRRVGDVLIIEDRFAAVEGCQDRRRA